MTVPHFFQDHAGRKVEVYIKEATDENIEFCNFRGSVLVSDDIGIIIMGGPIYPLFVDEPPKIPDTHVFIPWDRIGLVFFMEESEP